MVAATSPPVGVVSTSTSPDSGSAPSSAMLRRCTVTASADGVSPAPAQLGQVLETMYCSTRLRWASLGESARVCNTCRRALQNRPLYGLATRSRCGCTCTTGCSSVNRIQSRSARGSWHQGTSTSWPRTVSTSRRFFACHAPGHAAIAPSRMVSDGSGTRLDSVTVCATPRPWHCGHAPLTVLRENESESSRGAPTG